MMNYLALYIIFILGIVLIVSLGFVVDVFKWVVNKIKQLIK